jgi:hypothetical protein
MINIRQRFILMEVVSQPRITPEGKAQADLKAQQPRQYVSISRGLQRRHQGLDGVMKPFLETSVFAAPGCLLRGGQRQFIGQFSDEDVD